MEIHTYPYGPLQANMYVIVFDSDAIIIDPCVPFETLGLEGIRVRAIICTHSHYDHIVEAENIIRSTGSILLAYEDEKPFFSAAHKHRFSSFLPDVSISSPVLGLHDTEVLTADQLEIVTGDEFSLTVIHTPGHTSGSMCLFLVWKKSSGDKKYLFSGDTVFAGTVGRTDLGGSMPDMMCSIKKIAKLPDDTVILPGHGQATTIESEKRNNPYFTSIKYDDII